MLDDEPNGILLTGRYYVSMENKSHEIEKALMWYTDWWADQFSF